MGQLYYAQTQLYSIVLGVKISGQYQVNIAINYSLLGVTLHLPLRLWQFLNFLSFSPWQGERTWIRTCALRARRVLLMPLKS